MYSESIQVRDYVKITGNTLARPVILTEDITWRFPDIVFYKRLIMPPYAQFKLINLPSILQIFEIHIF